MDWFLLTILTFISLRRHAHGAAAPEEKLLLPAIDIVGSVFCDTCLQHQFSKTSHFISGASVLVKCLDGIPAEAKTDRGGQFRARLPPLSVGNIENCMVQLISSSEQDCSVPLIGSSSTLQLKSRREGVHTFAAGFLTFKPVNLPRVCRRLNSKKIRIPVSGSTAGHASSNPKHRKTIESSPTQSSHSDSDHKKTIHSFPESFLPPLPFQLPPFFPPIPGFTPPPLIPLPPIPGLTPPPPLIPLPPIPGFTPPSPPPLIPLPPIPFPGLTPPPPPPLFPLPPIPGFTPPSPPPAPFIPIPLPPIPIPGLTPPPPPPPPPPAFPIPLPPFPPLLPPFPRPPPHSPPSSLDKSRTTP